MRTATAVLSLTMLLGSSARAQTTSRSPTIVAVEPMVTLREGLLLRDSFDAAPQDVEHELNDALAMRQTGALAQAPWFSIPGSGYSAQQRVRLLGGTLAFAAWGSIRLQRPFALGAQQQLQLHTIVDPIEGDRSSLGWASIIVTTRADSNGWVAGEGNVFGFLVRSRGTIEIYDARRGTVLGVTPRWVGAPLQAADVYDVRLTLRPRSHRGVVSWELEGRVNEATFVAPLSAGAMPSGPLYLCVGSHGEYHMPQETRFREIELSIARATVP